MDDFDEASNEQIDAMLEGILGPRYCPACRRKLPESAFCVWIGDPGDPESIHQNSVVCRECRGAP